MLITENEIVCPSGKAGNSPLIIPFREILEAERRQAEVATITKAKAPELLHAFNMSWRILHENVAKLTKEKNDAQKAVDRRKSVILLEIAPKKLKDADLANNDDHRKAVVELDQEFQKLTETLSEIEAVIEYLKGKLRGFENAFTSVKRLVSEDVYHLGDRKNPALSGGTQATTFMGVPLDPPKPSNAGNPSSEKPTRPGFGRARF